MKKPLVECSIIRHSIVSLSDAGAHLTFFNDAAFGLHLLGHWARELAAMSISEAVRRYSPAGSASSGCVVAASIARRAMPPTSCYSIRRP